MTAGKDYAEAVNILGFDPDTGTASVTSLPQKIRSGDLSFRPRISDADGGILVGSRLADRLGVQPGDVVTLIPPKPPR
jgi:ABC-type lipoprotein release transport system permease subunit